MQKLFKLCPSYDGRSYTPHGLRVEGFNRSKRSDMLPEDLEVAQGNWQKGSESRYKRYTAKDILLIPTAIISTVSGRQEPVAQSTEHERPQQSPQRNINRAHRTVRLGRQTSTTFTLPSTYRLLPPAVQQGDVHTGRKRSTSDLPPGWKCEIRNRAGLAKPYPWYTNGHQVAKSRVEAYRIHGRTTE